MSCNLDPICSYTNDAGVQSPLYVAQLSLSWEQSGCLAFDSKQNVVVLKWGQQAAQGLWAEADPTVPSMHSLVYGMGFGIRLNGLCTEAVDL